MRTGRGLSILLTLVALALDACGDDDEASGGSGGAGGHKPQVTVSAAASLETAFTEYGKRFPDANARFSFAGNELVPAVPADGDNMSSLDDLARDGVTIAIGQEDVPVGSYTRTVLDKLPAAPVRATDGRLEAVNLPGDLQARVAYGVAVVKGAKQPEQAQAFIDGLLDGAGAHALKDARFEPPPGQ